MATTTRKKAVKLVWKEHPYGGQYANYKLGVITRYNGSYSVHIGHNESYNAKSLITAKRRIDAYTEKKTKK